MKRLMNVIGIGVITLAVSGSDDALGKELNEPIEILDQEHGAFAVDIGQVSDLQLVQGIQALCENTVEQRPLIGRDIEPAHL